MAKVQAPDQQGVILPPVRRKRTTLRPALLVPGLAVVIVALFAIGSAIESNPHPAAKDVAKPGTVTVAGVRVASVPAKPYLAPIISLGQPPADIVDSLSVPKGTISVSAQTNKNNTDQYDRTVNLRWHGSEAQLFGFYRQSLRSLGWRLTSSGPVHAAPGLEVLAQQAGSDGWYWQVGVTVHPTTFSESSSGSASGSASASAGSSTAAPSTAASGTGVPSATAQTGESTAFSVELIQESDDF